MRRGVMHLVAALSLAGCASPYIVTRDLRGHGPQKIYYIYPPAASPTRRVRVVVPLAAASTAACAATVAQSSSFTLRFRKSPFLAPTAVVSDRGSLPKSRGDFEAERDDLIAKAGTCLSADDAAAMGKRLWARLPRTFVDDLYDLYRFDTLNGTIDLQPGMRLRFEWQAFNVPDFGDSFPSSYIGAGTSFVIVARRQQGVRIDETDSGFLTFEPFLGWTNTNVDRKPNPRVAGSLDLEGPTHARKFYRLILPVSFGNSSKASNKASKRVMLVGANTPEELNLAPADLDNCGNAPDDPGAPICTPVAGRTLVIPEVPVRINGGDEYLPVGTTLRQIVDRSVRAWTPHSLLPLIRSHHGHLTSVVFIDPDDDVLYLPLAKGDRFWW